MKINMKSKVFLLSFFTIFLSASIAIATTIDFGDTSIYWPGWDNGQSSQYGYPPDDVSDTVGIPNFTGGTAEVQNGSLIQLTFYNATTSSSYWWVLSPGDLFIDTNSDEVWDYIVDLTNWTESGKNNSDPNEGDYNVYSVSLALDNLGYILSGNDNSDGWTGFLIRDDHPVAYDGGSYYGQVSFSGWDSSSPTSEYTFDFIEDGISLGDTFTIGWAPNCANDVIYETMANPTPTPEPATMLLLGSGLIGLAGLGRKKFLK
jgi:hypothetical protein